MGTLFDAESGEADPLVVRMRSAEAACVVVKRRPGGIWLAVPAAAVSVQFSLSAARAAPGAEFGLVHASLVPTEPGGAAVDVKLLD